MHVGNYQIAGVTVQIDSLYTQVHRMCREYACGEDLQPEIAVCIQPEDIANAFVFLASQEASYITGVVLQVDGLARS